jgi:3-hydroxyisobutyrate dehydrogenase-like beta-hydroxyacid dehydrogenase
MREHVGIIGVGLVGTAIAERLLASGYQVTGYDIRPEMRHNLERIGGQAACCPGAVVGSCERTILSLPTSGIVGSVLEEVRSTLVPGSAIIDTTTGAPEDAVSCAGTLARANVDYLDATVGGSSRQVRIREAIFICGGTREAFARCTDIFELCSKHVFHVGPVGSGARMKLVMNLVLGLNRAVLAEGLEFARASGVDPHAALEILKASPAYSRAMDTKGLRMLNEEFDPEARLSQHLKDVRLILKTGAQCDATLPLSTAHRELLEAAEAAGFGALDNCAVIKAFQKQRV